MANKVWKNTSEQIIAIGGEVVLSHTCPCVKGGTELEIEHSPLTPTEVTGGTELEIEHSPLTPTEVVGGCELEIEVINFSSVP